MPIANRLERSDRLTWWVIRRQDSRARGETCMAYGPFLFEEDAKRVLEARTREWPEYKFYLTSSTQEWVFTAGPETLRSYDTL